MCRLSKCCHGEIIDLINGGSMCCECNQLCDVAEFNIPPEEEKKIREAVDELEALKELSLKCLD